MKKRDYENIVKKVRAELRLVSGRFESTDQDLSSHSSTRERSNFYHHIKKFISKLKAKSILDLGCGLNPIALAKKNVTYYACDINQKNIEFVNNFFKENDLSGKAFYYDLRKIDSSLPQADLCLLFKVLDVIETKGHKLAEKIILSLNCKYLLISFSTKTLSGRPMNHPQRGWIEKLLERLNYKFQIIKSKNEIFYLVSKL